MNFDTHYRMSFDEMDAYESNIKNAKEKYGDKIEILLGYEVDYLPGYMDNRVLNADVDYLIGSIHFINKWGFDNPEFISRYKNVDIDVIWQEYFYLIESMAKEYIFDIVGHLDLIKVFKFLPKKDVRLIAKNALHAIKQSNMVIELNTAGLRKPIKEIYPSQLLLEVAYELDIPITFGSDAHAVEQVGYCYDHATKLAKDIGYTQAVTFRQRDRQLIVF